MERRINTIPELLDLLKNTKRHLFYVGPVFGTSMTNVNDFMPSFEMLVCSDPFFGAIPSIRVLQTIKGHQCTNPSQCQEVILKNEETIAYMKSKDPSPNVLFGMITPDLVEHCKKNGLNVWTTTPDLFQLLGTKVTIIDVLKKADIPFIPNICSKVESYPQLMEIAGKLGASSLVIQDQHGVSGQGTMFIFSQADYTTWKKELQCQKVHKIMPFRKLKSFAIGGVATKAGTVLGPLQSELIGHAQLTPNRGGYCGNQIRRTYFQDPKTEIQVRSHIFLYAERLGNYLYKQYEYRGVFGLDFVVDEETNEVFLMEMNPRLTGSTSLAFQVYRAQGYKFPIFLFHCLEFMEVEINLDITSFNKQWEGVEHYQHEYCQIIMKPFHHESIPYSFPAAVWKLENNVLVLTGSKELQFDRMKEDEILFIPNRVMANGIIVMKKRCQDYRFKLTKATEELIEKFSEVRFKDQKPNHA